MCLHLQRKSYTIAKEKVVTKEKVTQIENIETATKILDDMKEIAVTIHKKDFDNFEERCKVSSCWLNPDHEWFKRKLSTLKPDFYLKK